MKKAKYRLLARIWIGFTLLTDFFLLSYLLAYPESKLYDLATLYGWGITPSWVSTVLPVILGMLWLSFPVVLSDFPMGKSVFMIFTAISLGWFLVLFFYEPLVLHQSHWSKLFDGMRWFSFFYACWYYKFKSSPWK